MMAKPLFEPIFIFSPSSSSSPVIIVVFINPWPVDDVAAYAMSNDGCGVLYRKFTWELRTVCETVTCDISA